MLHMRQSVLLMLGTITCLGMMSASIPAFAQGSRLGSPLPDEHMLSREGLTRAWWAQAVLNASRDRVTYLTSDEENVYVQTSNGTLTTFDAETGKQRWSTRFGRGDKTSFAASTNGETVFVSSSLRLYALEKETGKIRNEFRLPAQPSTSVFADEKQFYLGFFDGSVYAFDLETGAFVWRYKTSGKISAPPISTGLTVLFASGNGSLYSVSADRRDLIFQFETDATLSAPLARYHDNVLVASEDFDFYSVNINNGARDWRFISGTQIKRAPVVVGNEIYLTPERGGMFQIDAQTGRERWWQPRIRDFVSVSPTRVYAINELNNLVILSRQTGDVQGGFRASQFPVHSTNDRTDRIYLATRSGTVVCLRERVRDLPYFHMNPEQQPIMPGFAPAKAQEPATP